MVIINVMYLLLSYLLLLRTHSYFVSWLDLVSIRHLVCCSYSEGPFIIWLGLLVLRRNDLS